MASRKRRVPSVVKTSLSGLNPNLLMIGAGLIAVYWFISRAKADMTVANPIDETPWYAVAAPLSTIQQGVTSAMVNEDKCSAAIAAGDISTMLFNCPTFNSDWPSGFVNWWNR
jgi:hypothetical protein